jgi:phospholipase C
MEKSVADAGRAGLPGPDRDHAANRHYRWSGMIDPSGTGGGPVIDDNPGPTIPAVNQPIPEQ